MNSENFAYWLKGYFEISDSKKLDEKQVQIIKDHLNVVFDKITPNRNQEVDGKSLLFDSTTTARGYSNNTTSSTLLC